MPKNNRHGQASIFTRQELDRVRKNLQNSRHRLLFDILRYTGERIGAVIQLRVEDVYCDPARSLPHSHITFRASTRKADTSGKRSTRQVPIGDSLKECLQSFQPPENGYLFPCKSKPEQYISVQGASWVLMRGIERAGLASRGFSTHSFRRTAITMLHEQGCDARLIQAFTGHKELRSVQQYIDIREQRVEEAVNLL